MEGDIFVADGLGDFPLPNTNDRIVKYSKDGKIIKAWGHHGSGRGEFNVPHGLFGHPSGVYIRDDIIYATDSQSNGEANPPFRQGIRIGSIKNGRVTTFISAPDAGTEMPEGVAADKESNVFGGITQLPDIKKYVRN